MKKTILDGLWATGEVSQHGSRRPKGPPPKFQGATWDAIDPSVQGAALPFIQGDHSVCVLTGPTRAGKTFAAWGITYVHYELGHIGVAEYVDFPYLYRMLHQMSSYPNEEQRDAAEEFGELRRAPYLFIDEFGVGAVKAEPVFMSLFELLNARYNNPKCRTILTTSRKKDALAAELTEPLVETRVFGGLVIAMNDRKAV